MEISTVKTSRIEVVDSLRGFAIMAILLVHNVDHFFFPEFPVQTSPWLNLLDQLTVKTIFTLFSGKTYAIFTMLFGFTFYIQHTNQKKKGKDFGYRFLWRMLLLALFAVFNSAFFPAGDVLMLFVYVSLILFICRNWSDRAVLALIIILMLQPVEWTHYVLSRINPAHQLPDFGAVSLHQQVVETTKNGSFFDFLRVNVTVGMKVSLMWALGSGRFLQAAGLFLLGFYIGRKQLFINTQENLQIWRRILLVSSLSFILFFLIKRMLLQSDPMTQQTAGLIFDIWYKLSLTFVLVASFVLLYEKRFFRDRVSGLRFYGKMSLTNYVSQSLFGALIYFPVGLYLAPYCGRTFSLLIGIAIFSFQMIFSRFWLSKHKQGPLETIWHRWTWINFGKGEETSGLPLTESRLSPKESSKDLQ